MDQMIEERFGSRYLLDAELGVGAMGTVYSATNAASDERVAIKILHRHLASDPSTVARFVQERETLTRAQHPNVVAVREMVVDEGRLGIVMELVEGRELRQLAAEGLDAADAVGIVRDVAAGLEAIHRAGIIHRDLKPANIMVVNGPDGPLPKITDFGVARILDSSTVQSTSTVGTPLYMAPEGAQTNPGAQAPADIYSLGVVLFELLVGHPPFTADNPIALIRAHHEDPPPRVEGVPAGLADLVDKMLAKDPAARPKAAEVRALLGGVHSAMVPGLTPTTVAAVEAAAVEAVAVEPGADAAVTGADRSVLESDAMATTGSAASSTGSWWGSRRFRLAALCLIAFALSGVAVFGALRLLLSDDTPEPAGYAFDPLIVEGDILVNRRWQFVDDRSALVATVTLLNFGEGATPVEHIEVFAPTMVDDVSTVSYTPTPDALLRGDTAARFDIDELALGATAQLGYVLTLDAENRGRDIEELAAEHEAAIDAFVRDRDMETAPLHIAQLDFVNAPATMVVGDTRSVGVQGELSDGSPVPFELASSVQWTSSDPDILSVEAGVLEAHATGSAVISAQMGDASVTGDVEVVDEPVDNEVAGQPSRDRSSAPFDGGSSGPGPQGGAVSNGDTSSDLSGSGSGQSQPVDPPGPILGSAPQATTINATSVRVTFTTNLCTTASYAGSGLLHQSPGWPNANVRCWTDHGHTFTGLTPGRTYTVNVDVNARDGRSANLGSIQFTVAEDTNEPLTGTPPAATMIDPTSFRVTFSTNRCTTASYVGDGLRHESPGYPDASANCWNSHGHTFTGLTPGQTYTVNVEVTALDGSELALGAVTFTVPGSDQGDGNGPGTEDEPDDGSGTGSDNDGVESPGDGSGPGGDAGNPGNDDEPVDEGPIEEPDPPVEDPPTEDPPDPGPEPEPEPTIITGGPPTPTFIDATSVWVSFTTNVCTTARYAGSGLLHESPGWPNANTQCWTAHGHTFRGLTPGQTYTVSVEVRAQDGTAKGLGSTTFTVPG